MIQVDKHIWISPEKIVMVYVKDGAFRIVMDDDRSALVVEGEQYIQNICKVKGISYQTVIGLMANG